VTHPSHRLWAEVVRICSELHWSLDTVLDLEHPVRQEVLRQLTVGSDSRRSGHGRVGDGGE
jgi:hypothetical protein